MSNPHPVTHLKYPVAHNTPKSGNVSSPSVKNYSEISCNESDSLLDVQLPTLQDYVNKVFDETEGLSEVKASNRATRLKHKISPGYISNIRTGKAKNPTIELLQGLAAAIGRPEDDVIAIARGKQLSQHGEFQESLFAVLWNEYKQLTATQKKEVRHLVEMLQREIQRRLTN